MPGIFGIVDPQKRLHLRILMKWMQKAMLHEPWYISNYLCREGIGLGRVGLRRTHSSNQPVFLL
jgi:hypothetical protein